MAAPEPLLTALLHTGAGLGGAYQLVGSGRFDGSTLRDVEPPLGAAFVVNPPESWSLRRLQRVVVDHTATAVLAAAFLHDDDCAVADAASRAANRWLSSTPGVFVADPLAWAGDAGTLSIPVDIEAPAAARRFVRAALRSWGRDDLAETATLVASELTTNAVLHAGGDSIDVTVARAPLAVDGVQITIGDDATGALPVWRRPTPTSRSGRGLRIVDAASTRWGVTVGSSRKHVWCEITSDLPKE